MPIRVNSASKPGVIINGAFFDHHSLALVNRELTMGLIGTERFDIGLSHFGPMAFVPDENPTFAGLAKHLNYIPKDAAVTIRHGWPPDFSRPETPRFVLMQPWEFGSLPRAWVRGVAESVDEVWVYTQFVRQTYLEAGVPAEKVFVVPCGVNTSRFNTQVAPAQLPTRKRFKFLFVGGTIARKGIDALVQAYSLAFGAADDVSLIIKDFGASSFYKGQDAARLIEEYRSLPGAPEIVHMKDDLSEAQIAALYAGADCLVHPYRGEGYGLPIAEAMACGKPTIITNYGAALDFATAENSYLVPATVVRFSEKRIGDLETVDYPYWAEPDRDALAATLRSVYENPEAAKGVGERAALDIAAKHTWAHAAEIASERILAQVVEAKKPKPAAAQKPVSAISDNEVRKQEALGLVRAGKWAEGSDLLQLCIAERPDDWDVLNALGICQFRLGERERAKATLARGIQGAPNPRDFYHNLAFVLLDEQDVEGAIANAMVALALAPDSAEIRRTVERSRNLAIDRLRKLRRTTQSVKTTTKGHKKVKQVVHNHSAAQKAEMEALDVAIDQAARMLKGERVDVSLPKPKAGRKTISLVMIAKNEERFLRSCLESVQGFVDEIVIVDTGSTDKTVAIAKEFGAKVGFHAWTDDFSEARNKSLELATGDWALWLDADEKLAKGQGELLRFLVDNAQTDIGGYMTNICNYMDNSDNPTQCWHRALRLFRRLPGVQFTGRIHEQNAKSIREMGYNIALCKLNIDHFGYTAEMMTERNKHERFIRMLKREVEENPDPTFHQFHLYNLANAYYTFGDLKTAAEWFEKCGENPDPKEEYAGVLFAQWATALYMTERPEAALEACARADKFGIAHPGIEFARAHAYIHLSRYDEAEKHFKRSIEMGASNTFVTTGDSGSYSYKAFYGLALAAMGRDDYEGAITHSLKALGEKSAFVDARYLLALAHRKLDHVSEARTALETLLKSTPEHGPARLDLVALLMDAEEFGAAIEHLRIAVEKYPNNADIWWAYASSCERLHLFDEAKRAYTALHRLSPSSPEVIVNLGRTCASLGKDAEAIDYFADAIDVDPGYANAYFNAADVLYKLGYFPKATEALYAGLQIDTENVSAFFVLGNCYFQNKEYQAAMLAYQTALRLKPDYDEAKQNLSLVQDVLKVA